MVRIMLVSARRLLLNSFRIDALEGEKLAIDVLQHVGSIDRMQIIQ